MLANSVKIPFLLMLLLLCGVVAAGQTPSGSGGIGPGWFPPGSAPFRMLTRPDPELPKDLDLRDIPEFVIILRAVFASDGKVKNIQFVKVTPNDVPKNVLDICKQRAIAAAKMIKFTPAMKNGRPVSMLFQMEYSFGKMKDPPATAPPDSESAKPKNEKPKV